MMNEMYWLICYDRKRDAKEEHFPDYVEHECVCGDTVIEAWEHLVNRLKETWPDGQFRLLGARPDIAPEDWSNDKEFDEWDNNRRKFNNNIASLVGRCQDKGLLAK